MSTPFVKSERLQKLPPYLFAEIDKKKKAAIAAGRDVINLGVGDPDRPTPEAIIQSLQHHVENPAFHQYALDQGAPELRRSIAAFCKRRYGLDLDPDSEILPLIGSKEGIAHFPLAVLNPGEISLVPDPCYPVYRSSSMFVGADVYTMPLEPALGFRPDLDAIPADFPFTEAHLQAVVGERGTLVAEAAAGTLYLADFTSIAHVKGGEYKGRRRTIPSPRALFWWNRATEMLKAKLDGQIALSQVARECKLSVSHFVRAFKQTVGEPPYRWLLQQRMDAAKGLLLHSGLPMVEIALKCGFADQACFIRAFRKLLDTTPGEWRRIRMQ